MKIDDKVEPMVRAVLDAAVNRDTDRFERALSAFDRAQLQAAVELAVAICAFVLFEIHDGNPTEADAQEIASDIGSQETWVGARPSEVSAFLDAVVRRQPMPNVLSQDGVIVLPFIVAANLLATSSQPEEGEWWFNYLDKVEAAIEAAG